MTTRALFRFASVRPAVATAEYPNLIFPADSPKTALQQSLAAQGKKDTGKKQGDGKNAKGAQANAAKGPTDLRRSSATRVVVGKLPELLALARKGDVTAVTTGLQALGDAGLGTGALAEDALWDGFLESLTLPARSRKAVSGYVDGIRLNEARKRSANGDSPEKIAAALSGIVVIPNWATTIFGNDTPAARGIVPAGVADLLVVEERLLRYELGEISYIENVMKTEKKERHHRRLDRSTTTYSVTTEESEESERDMQSTQRAEVASEITETVHTEMSLAAGVAISASYGPVVTVDASVDTALGTSTDTSTTASNTFAQDLVDRTVTKVTASRKEELIQQTLQEIEERSLHGFDNTSGTEHVNGIYRWLEQVWEAQIMNYGSRLMLDFMVPEPAALWRTSRDTTAASAVTVEEPEPLDLESALGVTEDNYGDYVAKYGVTGVTPPPEQEIRVSKMIELAELEHQDKLKNNDWTVRTASAVIDIPDGYVANYFDGDKISQPWADVDNRLILQIAGYTLDLFNDTTYGDLNKVKGPLEAAVLAYNMKACIVGIEVRCERTAEALDEWRLKTFEAIASAYKLLKDEYDAAVTTAEAAAAAATSSDMSSDVKREIEKGELKRGALTLLTGNDFSDRNAMSGPTGSKPYPVMDLDEAISEGDYARFFEHAFEWTQVTYVFYPYFWGRQDNWYDVLGQSDSDSTFEAFLRAGSARVQVPVRPGFEEAVLYYIETGEIWNGGDAPVVDDPLYLSMVDEVAESTGLSLYATEPFSDTWEYSIPTELVLVKDDAPDLGL